MHKVSRYNSLFKEWYDGGRYGYGDRKPLYPVPATAKVAYISTQHIPDMAWIWLMIQIREAKTLEGACDALDYH